MYKLGYRTHFDLMVQICAFAKFRKIVSFSVESNREISSVSLVYSYTQEVVEEGIFEAIKILQLPRPSV